MFVSLMILLTLAAWTSGENPALQVVLTDKGLQYGKHVGAGWLQEKLGQVSLPDITGAVWGVKYTLSGITVQKCDFPEPIIKFSQDTTGFNTSILGFDIAVAGQWATSFGIIKGGGAFSAALFAVNVVSVVELGTDADGRLSVSSLSCNAQVGDIMMRFSGKTSGVIQAFVNHFKGRIKSEIQSKICPGVEQSIASLEHHLQAINVSFAVGPDLTLNISLTSMPLINPTSLTLGFKGEFISSKTHQEPRFVAKPFTLPQQPGFMLSGGLSEYTVNSAAYGYYSAGLLEALISDSMIPPGSPVRLNTTSMGPFIPQLPKLFPDLLMELQLYVRETPMVSFQSGAVHLTLLGTAKAFAIQLNSTRTPLFKLNADSSFSGKGWISDKKLKGKVAMDNFTLTLEETEVGKFDTNPLEKMVKMAVTMGLLAPVNEKLAEGFDLPRMKHGTLRNPVLKVEEGFISVSSDVDLWLTD
ncbi:bactericidal permeability-increasing protein [Genypterus blacodes]|uniref:bactericidal permeability-increasing protein n=1 Tax=Genypterus blacodes TaxID=154954 RepID=UPI003F76E505